MTEDEFTSEVKRMQARLDELVADGNRLEAEYRTKHDRLRAEHDNLEAIMRTQMDVIGEISALVDRGDVAGIKANIKETAWRIGQATSKS